jgi:exodeoxyribonuclease-5
LTKPLNNQSFISIFLSYLSFTPTQDQSTLISLLAEFMLNNNDREIMVIKGYAGTGKTNMVAALSKTLPSFKWRSALLAPTGRAAKVLSNYSEKPAQTIHKKIFRKIPTNDGGVQFTLAENLHRNTVFIVDEASMIGLDNPNSESVYGSLLESLFEYVYSGDNCKLILVGDTAQLPPVGSNESQTARKDSCIHDITKCNSSTKASRTETHVIYCNDVNYCNNGNFMCGLKKRNA